MNWKKYLLPYRGVDPQNNLNYDQLKRREEADEANNFFASILATKTLTPIQVNVNLDNDEKCYYVENEVKLVEPRTVAQSKRSGYSVRVAKGVWVNTGNGKSVSTQQLQVVDTGSLFLTNKRIIFLGQIKTLNVKHKDILARNAMTSAISLSLTSGKNEYFVVNNSAIIAGMLQLVTFGDNLKEVPNLSINITVSET